MSTGLMASLVDTVQFAWDRFDVYAQMATEKVQHSEYRSEHRRGRKRKRMPDEKLHLNEANLSPRETFKVMIDSLLAELENRIKA